jgi:single-strand DNA-binding protein
MNDMITVRGVVASEVEGRLTDAGLPVANFRLASTERRRDQDSREWVDRSTNWYTVKAFRYLAQNIGSSLRKGDHVVVTGRLQLRQWSREDGRHGTAPEIMADAVGHDLKWGTARFARSAKSGQPAGNAAQEQEPFGAAAADPEGVDPATGEVFDDIEPAEDEPDTGDGSADGFRMAG